MLGKDALWREIVDSLTDAVLALSPELEVLEVNAAAETLFGASQIGKALLERTLRHNPWLAAMIRKCFETGQNLDYPETKLRLERREAIVRAEVSPLMNARGEHDGAVVLLHDLSHQKGTEHGPYGDQDSLRLSSAGLAHEVKNPLTGIKGAAELLAAMFPTDSRAQQYCGLILDGVNRITSLVEQVLAVSGPHRLKREPINIHQLLHEALRIAGAHPVPPRGVSVEQIFDPSLPEITGDAGALERVFLNLIRNALEAIAASPVGSAVPPDQSDRASEPGAVSTTATERGRLRLRTAIETQFRLSSRGRRRQFLRVEISDTGKGMNPEDVKQLFTPFFTTKPAGTGLGLVLSQRIVALHGGKLWAEIGGIEPQIGRETYPPGEQSALRGMTFCVSLPIGPD
ncbi:MAG TPA: ATP-binding protein [Candidatus Binataceae bacterium]|nr:ATP-binding protein [Candidatus Binataceae bacterium]